MGCGLSTKQTLLLITVSSIFASSGCTGLTAIPAGRMPQSLLAKPRADKEPINLISLRQDPPPVYQLGPNDILGVYIEGVLGQADQPPPVHFPEQNALSGSGGLPPSIGFPIPVREDGTVALPLVSPIRISGLTLAQAEDEIRNEYIQARILNPDKSRIIVTLMRKRTYQVLVVREDTSAGGGAGTAGGDITSTVGQSRRGSIAPSIYVPTRTTCCTR